jgi:ribosomal protein L11 methylase PrmA
MSLIIIISTRNMIGLYPLLRNNIEPGLLCDFLLELGACSVSLVDADAGTNEEEPIFSDLQYYDDDPLYQVNTGGGAWHNHDGQRPYWNHCQIVAQFPPTVYAGWTTRIWPLLHDQWEGLQVTDNGAVPRRDWVSFVQQNWHPLVVADTFLLTFPWHNDTDLLPYLVLEPVKTSGIALSPSSSSSTSSSSTSPSPSMPLPLIRLQLQGGVAFGTGEHATTQLCLEWVRDNLRARTTTRKVDENDDNTTDTTEPPRSTTTNTTTITMLDYGTGSGILGIAACLYGRAHGLNVTATGVDIDADACRIANANAAMNDVSTTMMQSYLPPLHAAVDDESRSLLLRALQSQQQQQPPYQTTAISGNDDMDDNENNDVAQELIWRRRGGDEQHHQQQPPEQFDLVVANILAGPLIALAPILARFCRGSIGLSGILPHQGSAVAEAYRNAGFTNVVVAKELNGWVLVTGDKNPWPPQS